MSVSLVLFFMLTVIVVLLTRSGKWPISAVVTSTLWGVLICTLPIASGLPGLLQSIFSSLLGIIGSFVGLG